MNQRFTLDGGNDLELRLADICEQARKGVLKIIPERKIAALVLGGGYGRGEGGVLREGSAEYPYNDLEFYILLRGNEFLEHRHSARAIHHLSEDLSSDAKIEVEFKLLGLRKLEQSSVTMFYYDLVSGHRLMAGPENWAANCGHHRAAHRIPLHEATRLLMNRCSGLLFAQERLARPAFTAEDADFVGRNLAKAKLAFGDVLLVARGLYHWSCRERNKRLRKLEPADLGGFSSLLPLHEQGVDFKLHPERSHRTTSELRHELNFLKQLAQELWLYIESARLGAAFPTTTEYSLDPRNKCPETRPWKNRLINLRRFGPGDFFSSRYPRERLLNALPVLLWENEVPVGPSAEHLRRQLRTSAADLPALVTAYQEIWRHYN